MNAFDVFPHPRSAPARRIKELGSRRDELQAEHRRLSVELDRLLQAREQHEAAVHASEARVLALADGQSGLDSARKALAATVKALDKINLGAVSDAVAVVEQEAQRVLAENADELLAEVTEDAEKVAHDFVDALKWLTKARNEYRQVWIRSDALTRALNDPPHPRVSEMPLAAETVAKGAAALAEAIPIPKPVRLPRGWPSANLVEAA